MKPKEIERRTRKVYGTLQEQLDHDVSDETVYT